MMRRTATVISLAVAMLLTGCTSPEATRTRASGPGADVGNRRSVVEIHGGADPYWHTPRVAVSAGSIAATSLK
jgi:hypothetical protein